MQNLGPNCRLAASESALQQELQVIHMLITAWEALP